MATRLYLANDTAGYSPTDKKGAWDKETNTLTKRLAPRPTGAAATVNVTPGSTTPNWDVFWGWWVSDPAITAGTISGTLSWVVGVLEANAACNGFWHVHVWVSVGDSDTVRGTLLTDNIGATEFTTTATGRGEGSKTVTSVAVSVGDRIIVEMGYRASSDLTTRSMTMNYGNTGTTDVTQGSTSVTTQAHWIEFSGADGMFYSPISTIVDNFDSGTLSNPPWTGNYGSPTSTGGRLRVPATSSGGTPQYAGAQADGSTTAYELDVIYAKLMTVPSSTGAVAEAYSDCIVFDPGVAGTYAGWVYDAVAAKLCALNAVGYADVTTRVELTYSGPIWVRLRRSGANLLWDTAPDGTTWTNRRTETAPSWTNYHNLGLLLEAARDGGTNDYGEWDNLNTVPSGATINLSGSATANASASASATRKAVFSGSATASTSASAVAKRTALAAGSAQARGTASATAIKKASLTGSATATASASATFRGVRPLGGSAVAQSVVGTTPDATVRSSSSYASAATEASSTVPLPSGWAVGDVVYLGCELVAATGTITTPTGWAVVVASFQSSSSTSATMAVYRRVMQAGDSNPVITHTSGRFAAAAVAVQSANPTVPEDVAGASDDNNSVTYPSVRAPSVTPASLRTLLLTFHGARNATNAATTSFAPPSGMTELVDTSSAVAAASNAAIEADWQALTSASATGTKTATATSSSGTTINQTGASVAVRPVASGIAAIHPIGGSAVGTSAASATVSRTTRLNGSALATGVASGFIVVGALPKYISGSANVTSSASGRVALSIRPAGTALARGTAQANVALKRFLTGSAQARGLAQSNAALSRRVGGSASAFGSAASGFALVRPLGGSALAMGLASGALTVGSTTGVRYLSGSATVWSGAIGIIGVYPAGTPFYPMSREELKVNRIITEAFIDANPTMIILIPRLPVKTGAGTRMVPQTPRPEQKFRIIDQSSSTSPIPGTQRTSDGFQRRIDFQLLGLWDSLVGMHDYFTDDDGIRWEITELFPDNGYERRAGVSRYGES